jgi:negative regulator of sigma-B (phosphoserine phosphatase)
VQVDAYIHGRPRIGEVSSGDAGAVRTVDGVTWVLLVDALGHGPVAAEAAARAVDEHQSFPAALSVEAAFARLHARLAGSRGAAATLLRFGERSLGFGGVGNVSLRTLVGPQVPFVPASGILGWRSLQMRCGELQLSGSGRLLLSSDGIVPSPPLAQLASLSAETMCQVLIAEHSLERDDATVIHVSYRA